MELKFDRKEIEAILIAKAQSFGIKANRVEFENSYGRTLSATVSFDETQAGEQDADALRKNAARYEWLRTGDMTLEQFSEVTKESGLLMDEAIDRAMESAS